MVVFLVVIIQKASLLTNIIILTKEEAEIRHIKHLTNDKPIIYNNRYSQEEKYFLH